MGFNSGFKGLMTDDCSKCHILKTSSESLRETEKISREGVRHRSVREFRSC